MVDSIQKCHRKFPDFRCVNGLQEINTSFLYGSGLHTPKANPWGGMDGKQRCRFQILPDESQQYQLTLISSARISAQPPRRRHPQLELFHPPYNPYEEFAQFLPKLNWPSIDELLDGRHPILRRDWLGSECGKEIPLTPAPALSITSDEKRLERIQQAEEAVVLNAMRRRNEPPPSGFERFAIQITREEFEQLYDRLIRSDYAQTSEPLPWFFKWMDPPFINERQSLALFHGRESRFDISAPYTLVEVYEKFQQAYGDAPRAPLGLTLNEHDEAMLYEDAPMGRHYVLESADYIVVNDIQSHTLAFGTQLCGVCHGLAKYDKEDITSLRFQEIMLHLR